MSHLPELPLERLALCFIPAGLVLLRLFRRTNTGPGTLLALGRMTLQLSLVGYVLVFIFELDSPWAVLGVLSIMLTMASLIALRPVARRTRRHRWAMLVALLLGPGSVLVLLTQFVLPQERWYAPSFVIPLAGMILAQSMNALSVAAERFERERAVRDNAFEAVEPAFGAGMIGITNSLLAVGVVSLPGMMTGQILAGVSPLIAARYQILVMCSLFGASGIAIAVYLHWLRSPQATSPGREEQRDAASRPVDS